MTVFIFNNHDCRHLSLLQSNNTKWCHHYACVARIYLCGVSAQVSPSCLKPHALLNVASWTWMPVVPIWIKAAIRRFLARCAPFFGRQDGWDTRCAIVARQHFFNLLQCLDGPDKEAILMPFAIMLQGWPVNCRGWNCQRQRSKIERSTHAGGQDHIATLPHWQRRPRGRHGYCHCEVFEI